jgi:hypothetical protein
MNLRNVYIVELMEYVQMVITIQLMIDMYRHGLTCKIGSNKQFVAMQIKHTYGQRNDSGSFVNTLQLLYSDYFVAILHGGGKCDY